MVSRWPSGGKLQNKVELLVHAEADSDEQEEPDIVVLVEVHDG
jgi:hypothetical protein